MLMIKRSFFSIMVSRIKLKLCVFLFLIGYSTGVSDYHNAFSTLTSNVDPFCQMPQWDSISSTDLTGLSPQQDLYDSLLDDSGMRGKRSLSMYYPPMVLSPSALSTWHQCTVPQILTIDSSILAKPLACKTETLPMCVQMMEIPGSGGTPISAPIFDPEYSAEITQPLMDRGASAACTAADSEEESPCLEVATEAPKKTEKEEPVTDPPEEPSPVAGLLAKVFTPSALAELSKFEEKTEKGEGSNVKRQTLPDLPPEEALILPDCKNSPSLDELKTKILKDALADPKSAISSLLPVLSLLSSAAKSASPPPCSCASPPPCVSTCPSSSFSSCSGCPPPYKPPTVAPPNSAPGSGSNGLLGLDASVLGPKGLLDIDANILKLIGLDLSLLGPKGVLNLDASVPSSPSSPAPPPPQTLPAPAPPTPSKHSGHEGLLDLDASLLGPKGLLDLHANILKLLGLDLSLLGPKGVLSLDANVPNLPLSPAPPATPALPAPPVLPAPASSTPSKHSGHRGLLDLDASLLGPKGLLDLDANVLNLLGLDLSLLGPKGVLSLDANIPNPPSPPGSSPPTGSKLPLDPSVLKLLLKILGPKAVLILLARALGPAVLLALLNSSSKSSLPQKCCPCSPSPPCISSGILDLDASLVNGGLTNVLGSDGLIDLDLAVLDPPAVEIPANPIYEIYGNSYTPIMPLCTKTCTMPVCNSVRPSSSCSASLRPVNTIHALGPLAKLLKAPDETVDAPPEKPLTHLTSLPNPTDALPQVSTNLTPSDALPTAKEDVDSPEEVSPSSGQENSPVSTVLSPLKSLPKSGNCYSLAKSLSRFMNIPSAVEEPVGESVNSVTESVPTTVPPQSPNGTETSEDGRDLRPSSNEIPPVPEFALPRPEPDAELINASACNDDLPQKMSLLSEPDSSCRRRFLETISQPVLKHFTYQLDLPH